MGVAKRGTGSFARTVALDLVSGIRLSQGRLALAALIVAMVSLALLSSCLSLIEDSAPSPGQQAGLSPREAAAFFLAGADFYRFDGRTPFTIPATWILEQAAVALLVGSYAYDDLESRAVQVFVRSGERARWWTGKCAWTFVMAALFHAMMVLAAVILPAALSAAVPSELGPEGQIAILGFALPEAGSSGNMPLFLAPAFLSAALSMCQVSLSLNIGPTAAFLAVLCYEVASAYSDMPLLIAANAMIARSSLVQVGGYDPCLTIATSAATFTAAAFIGLVILRRKDLIGKEG